MNKFKSEDGMEYTRFGDGWLKRKSKAEEWTKAGDIPADVIRADTLKRLRKGAALGKAVGEIPEELQAEAGELMREAMESTKPKPPRIIRADA